MTEFFDFSREFTFLDDFGNEILPVNGLRFEYGSTYVSCSLHAFLTIFLFAVFIIFELSEKRVVPDFC